MSESIVIDSSIDEIFEPTSYFKYRSEDCKLAKAGRLIAEAAVMASEASRLLSEFALEGKRAAISLHAELASNVALEVSTLAAATVALCKECAECRK